VVALSEQFFTYSDRPGIRGGTPSPRVHRLGGGDAPGADDAAEARAFRLDELPSPLCFDHATILDDYRATGGPGSAGRSDVTLHTSLLFLVLLGIALALHEAAHALAARLAGVPVHRFTLGAGPRLWSRTLRSGTELVLRAVPIWASAELEGPALDARAGELWRRALVIAAGPLSSLALAFLALAGCTSPGRTCRSRSPWARWPPAPRRRARSSARATGCWRWTAPRWRAGATSWTGSPSRPGRSWSSRSSAGPHPPGAGDPQPGERGGGRIGLSQQYVFSREAPDAAFARAGRHLLRSLIDTAELALRGRAHGSSRAPGAGWLGPTPGGIDRAVRGVALLSALLGAFHLLPLPPLDGGALLLLLLERRRRARYRPATGWRSGPWASPSSPRCWC